VAALCSCDQDRLIREHAHLAKVTARALRRYAQDGLEIDDLEGAASFGLCKAARSFDPARRVSFRTYAIALMRGAVLEQARKWDYAPRSVRERIKQGEDLVATRPVSLENSVLPAAGSENGHRYADLMADDAAGPELLALGEAQRAALLRALDLLPERERFIVFASYQAGRSLLDISKELGISESRVYQLRASALKRLRGFGELRETVMG